MSGKSLSWNSYRVLFWYNLKREQTCEEGAGKLEILIFSHPSPLTLSQLTHDEEHYSQGRTYQSSQHQELKPVDQALQNTYIPV